MAINFITKSCIILACTLVLYGCGQSFFGPDPQDAESIYNPYAINPDEFTVTQSHDKDGFTAVCLDHNRFAFSSHYTLYSPKHNLCLILSGCSECAELNGYKIKYAENGRVSEVTEVNYEIEYDLSNIKVLKRVMKEKSMEGAHFLFERDEYGILKNIGNIEVPSDYTAYYYIQEWPGFWDYDIYGGEVAFIVLLEADDKANKSAVDILYVNGKLAAELAYWNGVFIKALYYDDKGFFCEIDDDRNADILSEVYMHFHFNDRSRWYLNK